MSRGWHAISGLTLQEKKMGTVGLDPTFTDDVQLSLNHAMSSHNAKTTNPPFRSGKTRRVKIECFLASLQGRCGSETLYI